MLAWLEPFMAHLDDLPARLYPLPCVPLRMASTDLYLDVSAAALACSNPAHY